MGPIAKRREVGEMFVSVVEASSDCFWFVLTDHSE